MSNESREHNQRWIQELWQRYTKNVESIRDLTEGTIDKYIVGLSDAAVFDGRSNAEFAEALGLVDKIVDSVTVKRHFQKRKFGTQDEDKIKHVSFSRYLSDIQQKDSTPNAEQIGLIVAQGTIVDGQAPETSIGSSSFVELLKRAQKDYSLKALIIRVDSGGGSAFCFGKSYAKHIEKNDSQRHTHIHFNGLYCSIRWLLDVRSRNGNLGNARHDYRFYWRMGASTKLHAIFSKTGHLLRWNRNLTHCRYFSSRSGNVRTRQTAFPT